MPMWAYPRRSQLNGYASSVCEQIRKLVKQLRTENVSIPMQAADTILSLEELGQALFRAYDEDETWRDQQRKIACRLIERGECP